MAVTATTASRLAPRTFAARTQRPRPHAVSAVLKQQVESLLSGGPSRRTCWRLKRLDSSTDQTRLTTTDLSIGRGRIVAPDRGRSEERSLKPKLCKENFAEARERARQRRNHHAAEPGCGCG
jgi:hypothetical protein